MKRLEKLPSAFKRYDKMLGVLDFAVFEDANGTEDEILSAIPQTLSHAGTFDAERLRSLGWSRLRERKFFGDWYDVESGMLLRLGSYTTADGSELQDPKLKRLEGVKICLAHRLVPSRCWGAVCLCVLPPALRPQRASEGGAGDF